MAEFNNREDLERWLKDRPREDAAVIATRAALRVAPLLVVMLEEHAEERRTSIILPSFHIMAALCIAVGWSADSNKLMWAASDLANDRALIVRLADGARMAHAARAVRAAAYASDAKADRFYIHEAAADAARDAANAVAQYHASPELIWEAIGVDATSLERGSTVKEVMTTGLWPRFVPQWAKNAGEQLRSHLLFADEGWEVWTDWYEDRLLGRPFNKVLEEARVLIPEEIWEQGPKAVNAEIKRLIEKHAVEGSADVKLEAVSLEARAEVSQPELRENDPLTARLDAALTSVELRAALTSFKYDPATNRVELVPFAEDLPELPTNALRADHANKLSALAEGCTSLASDLKQDEPNVPKALARDLRRYAKQAGNGPELANPRVLRIYGAALARAHGDSETMLGLGTYLGGKLADIVVAHAKLQTDYPASVEERMEAAADIPLAPEATPDAIAETLDLIATDLPETAWGDLPVPSRDLSDLLHDQAEQLREIERRIDRTEDAKDRAVLERMRQQTAVSALSTIARFTVFTASVAVAVAAVAVAPLPAIGMAAAGVEIVQFVDSIFPGTLKPHLRRVINWLFFREPDSL